MKENEAIDVLQYLLGHENAVDKGTLDATNCLNSQEKEALKLILEENQQYRAIGTVEECRTAVERMKPKKGIPYTSSNNHKFVECPNCHKDMDLYYDFCQHCGQAVEWGKKKS